MSTATAQSPTKFTFDLDLATSETTSRVISEVRIREMTDTARTEGYAQGLTEGEQNAVASAARSLSSAAEKLGQNLARLTTESLAERKANKADAIDLAGIIARKLNTHLTQRLPDAELTHLIADCMTSLEDSPHLVIRCNPDLCDAIQETADAQMAAAGVTGKLIVMGDPEIALGDGRVEWVDGGVVRDNVALGKQIDDAIDQFLDAHGLTRPQQPTLLAKETDQ